MKVSADTVVYEPPGTRKRTCWALPLAAEPLLPAARRPPHTRWAFSTVEPAGRLTLALVEFDVEPSLSTSAKTMLKLLLPELTLPLSALVQFVEAGQVSWLLPVRTTEPFSWAL